MCLQMIKKFLNKLIKLVELIKNKRKINTDLIDIDSIRKVAESRLKITYKFLTIVSVGFGFLFLTLYHHCQQNSQVIIDEMMRGVAIKTSTNTMLLFSAAIIACFVCMISALQSLASDGNLMRIDGSRIKKKDISEADLHYVAIIPTTILIVAFMIIFCFGLLKSQNIVEKLMNPYEAAGILNASCIAFVALYIIGFQFGHVLIIAVRRVILTMVMFITTTMMEGLALGIYSIDEHATAITNNWINVRIDLAGVVTVVIAAASLVTSVLALAQTCKQNKKQNNQFLFKKRFGTYKLINNINKCINSSAIYFADSENELFLAKDAFCKLVNFAPLYTMANGMEDPINKNNAYSHQDYLKAKQVVEEIAGEASLIFDSKFNWVSKYILSYILLVDAVRNYQIWQAKHDGQYDANNPPSIEKAQAEQQSYHHDVLIAWNELKILNENVDLSKLQKFLKL